MFFGNNDEQFRSDTCTKCNKVDQILMLSLVRNILMQIICYYV